MSLWLCYRLKQMQCHAQWRAQHIESGGAQVFAIPQMEKMLFFDCPPPKKICGL